jgi:ABC-type glutathione transport system ATPase component
MSTSPTPFLHVEGLTKHFRSNDGWIPRFLNGTSGTSETVKAVTDVSFSVGRGEVYGFVGESGCGKTTLARTLLRLTEPTRGTARVGSTSIFDVPAEAVRMRLRPHLRMIFQHPDAVLNPSCTVGRVLDQALRLHTPLDDVARQDRAEQLLDQVHLPPDYLDKYPGELSGGQKRRIGICQALATDPEVIVADEPFAGLDVSLKEQIVTLFQSIQAERNLTVLLISHDLGIVRRLCDSMEVMKEGRLVEELPSGAMTSEHCSHRYAADLLQTHLELNRHHSA